MPIPAGTILSAIPSMLAIKVAKYNDDSLTAGYNIEYNKFIVARKAGILASGNLGYWIAEGEAATVIQMLLEAFGMNARNSSLVPLPVFQKALSAINPVSINWIANFSLPLDAQPPKSINPTTGATLSAELQTTFNLFATPGIVTVSGGYVAASKTMHCLFPELAPMIDGTHSGISYYNIDRRTYAPPLGLSNWNEWIGTPIVGMPNPYPRGAGRIAWKEQQFMAAIGVNQHIYELWQAAYGNPGLREFLAIDPVQGTTGIPKIIDKGLW
jgi:hypothetical protein